jgi:hypothetical protein
MRNIFGSNELSKYQSWRAEIYSVLYRIFAAKCN